MRPQRSPTFSLWILFLLFTLASCVDIEIQRDEIPPSDATSNEKYYSFSGILEFTGDVDPGNRCELTDGKFVKLLKMAHDKMRAQVGRRNRPGAMGALQYGRKIYFASSITHNWSNDAFISVYQETDTPGSVGHYINTCLVPQEGEDQEAEGEADGGGQEETGIEHRQGAHCSEPNIIRLVHQNDMPGFGSPAPNRFAVWQASGAQEGKLVGPCEGRNGGIQGCKETFATQFELNPIPEETDMQDVNLADLGVAVAENQRPAFS